MSKKNFLTPPQLAAPPELTDAAIFSQWIYTPLLATTIIG